MIPVDDELQRDLILEIICQSIESFNPDEKNDHGVTQALGVTADCGDGKTWLN